MKNFYWGLFIGIVLTLLLMVGVIVITHPEAWHSELIYHGCGQYSPTTGKFEWKDQQ